MLAQQSISRDEKRAKAGQPGQSDISGWFEVYHGPTIVVEFITGKLEKFPVGDKQRYELAKTQLNILHKEGITHNHR